MIRCFFEKLGRFFSPSVLLDANDLRYLEQANKDVPPSRVVYVFRRPSLLQSSILRAICEREGFLQPFEEISQDPRKATSSAMLFALRARTGAELTVTKAIDTRKERDERLASFIEHSEAALQFVPVSFFAGLGPRPFFLERIFSFDFRFMPVRDLFLCVFYFFNRKNLRLEIAEPISGDVEGRDLSKRLSRALYRSEKLAGRVKSSSTKTVEEMVLSGERFENALTEYVEQGDLSREQAYLEAQKKFREIAATMKWGAVRVLYYALRPVVNRVFSKIEVQGIEELRRTVAEKPTIVLPSHKSHFDYILVGWVFFHYNLPLPYVAAGANMNFFPVGAFFKAAGGFFIRRRIEGDYLYRIVLDNYLGHLVKKGHVVAFYIEGGRSRSGIARSPKLGLLKYVVQNWTEGKREDIALVPLGITYERIAEENALLEEQKGGKKRRESLLELLKLRSIFSKRFGSVMLHVGPSVSLREFSDSEKGLAEANAGSLPRLTEDLGFTLSRGIMECTAVTGSSLCASAIDSFLFQSTSIEVVKERMYSLLRIYGAHQGVLLPEKGLVLDSAAAEGLRLGGMLGEVLVRLGSDAGLREVLDAFSIAGYLETSEVVGEIRVQVPDTQRLKVDYYKNTTLHYFIAPATLTLSALGSSGQSPTKVLHQFHQLFKHAFLLPFWRVWSTELVESSQVLRDLGYLDATSSLSRKSIEEETSSPLVLSESGRRELLPLARMFTPLLEALLATVERSLGFDSTAVEQADFLDAVEEHLKIQAFSGSARHPASSTTTNLQFALRALVENDFLLYRLDSFGRAGDSSSALTLNLAEKSRLLQLQNLLSSCLHSLEKP